MYRATTRKNSLQRLTQLHPHTGEEYTRDNACHTGMLVVGEERCCMGSRQEVRSLEALLPRNPPPPPPGLLIYDNISNRYVFLREIDKKNKVDEREHASDASAR